jgi:hypothetical protein
MLKEPSAGQGNRRWSDMWSIPGVCGARGAQRVQNMLRFVRRGSDPRPGMLPPCSDGPRRMGNARGGYL